MKAKPRALARSAAQVMAAAVVGAGSVVAFSTAAQAAPPAVTAVVVTGGTGKVVTAGTTITITGTGFSGMTDNAADPACSITPAVASPCSQVRFVGQASTATTGYTLAARYTVVSDTTMYVVVPSGIPNTVDNTTLGAPVPGTGSMKVQVVNTMPGGTSNAGSLTTGTGGEVFYRAPLTASFSGSNTLYANPMGGGSLAVDISTSPIAALTSGTTGTFVAEKITAYVVNSYAGSPRVNSASVTFNDTDTVNVVLPAGSVSSEVVNVMLLHDGIPGTADTDSLEYPAVITKIESCTADVTTVNIATLPTCTGAANAPGTASTTADFKVTGKGFTGASAWAVGATANDVTETCTVVSDTMAFCHLAITTVPTGNVAALSFTPDDPDNAANPDIVATAGSIIVFSNLL
jgi:hypothetical protein